MLNFKNSVFFSYIFLGFWTFSTVFLFCFAPQEKILFFPRLLAELRFFPTHNFGSAFASPYGLGVHVKPPSTEKVSTLFEQHEFHLDPKNGYLPTGKTVPRIYLANIPADWKKFAEKNLERKRVLFIKMLIPLILEANERVLEERSKLLVLRSRAKNKQPICAADRAWFAQIKQNYKIEATLQHMDDLLARVDVIPPSLALAQAAVETGWGSSHAALKKNSVFGHMATPVRVADYPNLHSSVRAYISNLNQNRAYAPLHRLREKLRSQGKNPSGHALASGLMLYSIRRGDYIAQIKGLIVKYKLDIFDRAALATHSASR